ncbi:MAG: STAS domain-containing protein [Cyanobacteria bacterium P01_H01_bin.119]
MDKVYGPAVVVMQPVGNLNASNADGLQREMIDALAPEHVKSLVMDLEKVELFDSAALAALMAALKTAKSAGKRFSLRSVPPSIRIVMELTQLDRAFDIADDLLLAA